MKIKISKVEHRGQKCLKLDFEYNTQLVELVKKLPNRKWSKTLHAWLIPDTEESLADISRVAGKEKLQFEEVIPAYEQAVKHEIIIHKVIDIEVINRKIRIKMPRNDADIEFVKAIRFSRWNKEERCWEIPDYPGNLDQLSDYFGQRIATLTKHDIVLTSTAGSSNKIIGSKDVLLMRMRSERVRIIAPYNKAILNHGYETPKQALETYSAAELLGIKPSAFGGIIHRRAVHEIATLSCSTNKFQCTAFLKFEFHE